VLRQLVLEHAIDHGTHTILANENPVISNTMVCIEVSVAAHAVMGSHLPLCLSEAAVGSDMSQ
jgi:hypothetical protein